MVLSGPVTGSHPACSTSLKGVTTMHDGSAEPGSCEPVRRMDVGVSRTVSRRAAAPRAVPIRELEAPSGECRRGNTETRLLEQAYEDYYSL